MSVYPLLLTPSGKDYLWGGENLKEKYNKNIDLTPLAETWECSVHPDGPSYIENGEYKGLSLAEVINKNPGFLGGKCKRKELPILVKFIDAAKDLSVQVHPDDKYAFEFEDGQNGKTEMWYILDAEDDAKLVWGFEHNVTPELLKKSIEEGRLQNNLHYVSVKKGDVFLIEAGTVHAIGKGIILAEIQESSNLTYRLYDYNRKDSNGNTRELHFDKAIKVLNMQPNRKDKKRSRLVKYFNGYCEEILCRCKYFCVKRIRVNRKYLFEVEKDSFQIILCLDGDAIIHNTQSNQEVEVKKGRCVFLPASCGECEVYGNCNLLRITC